MQAKETKHENKQKQSIPEKAVNFAASAPIQLTICLIYLGFGMFVCRSTFGVHLCLYHPRRQSYAAGFVSMVLTADGCCTLVCSCF